MRATHLFACALASLILVNSGWSQAPDETRSGSALDLVQQRRGVVTNSMKTAVADELDKARELMTTDPTTAEVQLKITLEVVHAAGDLDPEVRHQLIGQLKAALRQAAHSKLQVTENRRVRQQSAAQRKARRRLIENQIQEQDKAASLMDRFRSLMAEHRYLEAEEEVAAEVALVIPSSPLATNATLTARYASAHEDGLAIRQQRSKGQAGAMVTAERAAIPFGGDLSIVFPPAEVWESLSHRRAKYASVDLQERSKSEKDILTQLKTSTRVDFEETPLDEVAQYIAEYHDIDVVLDQRALDELGIGSDTPVTLRVRGISLRSALRLMLDSIDPAMTYGVNDEVLKITTREEAEEDLTTRNYPVADLVLPMQNLNFVGSGGFGGSAALQGFGAGAFGGGQNTNRQPNQNDFMDDPAGPFGF